MIKEWLAKHLRFLADRMDPEHSFRATEMSFPFEENIGIVFDTTKTTGCPIRYYNPEYKKAHQGEIDE